MGKLSDRLSKADDESVVYRADDAEQRVRWGPLVGGLLLGSVLVKAGTGLLPSTVGGLPVALLMFAGAVVVLIAYIVWRRRRNKRLTGSATTWPSTSGDDSGAEADSR